MEHKRPRGRPASVETIAARRIFQDIPMTERSMTNMAYLTAATAILRRPDAATVSGLPWLFLANGKIRSVVLYRLGRWSKVLGTKETRRLAKEINQRKLRTVAAVELIERRAGRSTLMLLKKTKKK